MIRFCDSIGSQGRSRATHFLSLGFRTAAKANTKTSRVFFVGSWFATHPPRFASRVGSWVDKRESIAELMREDDSFNFKNENLPVRVCFAKHVRFMQDKASAPEFFCWPGMYFAEHKKFDVDLNRSGKMWLRHQPLFAADIGGEIRPTLFSGKTEKAIYETFNEFYRWNVLYDMTRQWITRDGAITTISLG